MTEAVQAEVQAVTQGLGLLDATAGGVLLVRGAQAGAFLNGLLTSNVAVLPVGGLQPALLCDTKGRLLQTLDVARTKEAEYLLLPVPGSLEALAAHLEFHHIREDVALGRVELARLELWGPLAQDVLHHLGLPLATVAGQWQNGPLVVLADPLQALARRVVLVAPGQAPALREALLAANPAVIQIGAEALAEALLWASVPSFPQQVHPGMLPAEAALYTHLAFQKGCYVGQEIHARMHYRGHPNHKLCRLDLPAAAATGLALEAPLFQNGQQVGQVVALARWPRQGRLAAMAWLRYTVFQAAAPVSLSADGPPQGNISPLATDLGGKASPSPLTPHPLGAEGPQAPHKG